MKNKTVDCSDMSKNEVIEMLYDMENLGFVFDKNFKLIDNDLNVTKIYMNKSLDGGWCRKYMSKEELNNKM